MQKHTVMEQSRQENNIRVSIIVPVYNVEKYVEECLRSVANQTVANEIECIIVDDCGQDNSVAIIESFIREYNGEVNFKLLHHEMNRGLSAARNTGIQEARGEYIYFLDSDDYIIPIAMERLLCLADKHGGVDLLPAYYITQDNSMSDYYDKTDLPEFSDDKKVISWILLDTDKFPVTAANRLVRRELFLKNDVWFREGIIYEDNHWAFFLAKYVRSAAFTKERLYYYRCVEGSISRGHNKARDIISFNIILNDFIENIDNEIRGAQKHQILNTLILVKENRNYSSEEEFESILKRFYSKNNIIERCLLRLLHAVYAKTMLRNKVLHVIRRVYMYLN